MRRVSASGYRIFTPEIPDIGKIRIRYPIAPVHQEGNAIWKNMAANQDILMNMKKYESMFEAAPAITGSNANDNHKPNTHYITSTTHADPPGMHAHDLYLTDEEMTALQRDGTTVSVYTSEDLGHQHELVLKMDPKLHGSQARLTIVSCDGLPTCWDHHNKDVYIKL